MATTLAGIVSVLLVAWGLRNTQDANLEQQKLALQAQASDRQGQAADRFTAAIGQIGRENPAELSIRLGGIYSLQQLMRDSPADEPAAMQVLCAFVRTHAARPAFVPEPVPNAPLDVRAALEVLGHRPDPMAPQHEKLDLSNTLLGISWIDLHGVDLQKVYLREADLRHANLVGADLREATLSHTDLSDADLTGAHLNGANLEGADLSNADLTDAVGLTKEQLSKTNSVVGATLPAGLRSS